MDGRAIPDSSYLRHPEERDIWGIALVCRAAETEHVPGIDFCSIAKGYGVDERQATSSETFVAALCHALAGHQPMLIESRRKRMQFDPEHT
jgi:thiamine pyrophosphate-dependent acetolactate synthase large subunit-like protein